MESNAAQIEEIYSVDWGRRENKAPLSETGTGIWEKVENRQGRQERNI